jgi:hypothetical protein
MRWAGHVAGMGEEKKDTDFWGENQKERDHQEDIGICGMIISKYIVEKCNEVIWTKCFVLKLNEVSQRNEMR